MNLKQQFEIMAAYNRRMNESLYAVSATLSPTELERDERIFFGSILGTLNHVLVADTIWLKRFTKHPGDFASLAPLADVPMPSALNAVLHPELEPLHQARRAVDAIIVALTDEATDEDYGAPLVYANMKAQMFGKPFGLLVQHLFNHQTHHRGQVSALLTRFGRDYGVTDLLVDIPDASLR